MVVTGVGVVSAAGWGVPAFCQAIGSGRTAIGPFDRFSHLTQRTHLAGQVPPPPRVPSLGGWARLANSDRFALYAAFEGLAQAGLTSPLGQAVGVFFGSSTGGLLETEQYYDELVRPDGVERRGLLASHHLSSPAEAVARHFGVEGPVETVSSACASATLAIGQALEAVRDGEVKVALAGGADCLAVTTYTGFNALRAVDESPCRPFRADRAGLSLGEGGAVLVLETAGHALARGAVPLIEVLGAASSCDATHMTAPHPEGRWAAAAIAEALGDAALAPEQIGYLNAHGTGTPLNDAAERAAMSRAFGGRSARLPVEATKGVVGHLLGAAGAVEAVAVTLALLGAQVHPAPGDRPADPSLEVDLVVGQPRSVAGLRAALSISLGFGGANAALVFGRWPR